LAAGTVAVIYGLLGALAAVLTRGLAEPLPAGLTLAGFGLAFAGIGALAESRVLRRAARRLPGVLRDALRTGTVAALLVLAAGAAEGGGLGGGLAAGPPALPRDGDRSGWRRGAGQHRAGPVDGTGMGPPAGCRAAGRAGGRSAAGRGELGLRWPARLRPARGG